MIEQERNLYLVFAHDKWVFLNFNSQKKAIPVYDIGKRSRGQTT